MLKKIIRGLVGDRLYLRAYREKAAVRQWIQRAVGKEPSCRIEVCCEKELHGDGSGAWCFCPTGLGPEFIVYNFGVGREISFERSIISTFGMQVFAFDPTPLASDWIASQQLPPEFHFLKIGIASYDGEATFRVHGDDKNACWSMSGASRGRSRSHVGQVRMLATIARMLGHERIDVLKMDIEGAEYDVIQNWLDSGIHVSQLLIEFHHRFQGVGIAKTEAAIARLNEAGFRLFHVSRFGPEYGFVRR